MSIFTISKDADLKGLAVAFVGRALDELRSPDPVEAIGAALWLTGDDFPLWAECIGMPFADGLKLLASGAARRYKGSYIEMHARRKAGKEKVSDEK